MIQQRRPLNAVTADSSDPNIWHRKLQGVSINKLPVKVLRMFGLTSLRNPKVPKRCTDWLIYIKDLISGKMIDCAKQSGWLYYLEDEPKNIHQSGPIGSSVGSFFVKNNKDDIML